MARRALVGSQRGVGPRAGGAADRSADRHAGHGSLAVDAGARDARRHHLAHRHAIPDHRYLRDIAQHVRSLQRTINDMDDVLDFRDAELQVADARRRQADFGEPRRAGVRACRVSLQGRAGAVVRSFSLQIPLARRSASSGQSGAGKSTFVKLIQRLYDLDGGRILIDGQDIAQVTQASLREAVGPRAAGAGPVPSLDRREHRLWPAGRHRARDRGGREARACGRIRARLPKGYATLVGERGVKFSGGERQRVAIARAILADAPILILDEATSSLDSLSETISARRWTGWRRAHDDRDRAPAFDRAAARPDSGFRSWPDCRGRHAHVADGAARAGCIAGWWRRSPGRFLADAAEYHARQILRERAELGHAPNPLRGLPVKIHQSPADRFPPGRERGR